MGADGGFTQNDIVEVARALTGWSHTAAMPGGDELASLRMLIQRRLGEPVSFVFDSTRHDAEEKVVLGHTLRANRGMEDGEDVLDILARHPATARHISRKLAIRFVSDNPPESLVDAAAATFLRSNGDIREVMRTILMSAEFRDPRVFGTKVKSPLEFVLSLRRALAAPVDLDAESIDLLVRLDQPPLGRISPDGWPETGEAWMNVGAMRMRMDIAEKVAFDLLPSIRLSDWPAFTTLVGQSFDQQLSGVTAALLGGQAAGNTISAMMSLRPAAGTRVDTRGREQTLRELVAFALGTPEFQRR
jgi:uncharacterized protein (DUF1800 family)